MSHDLDQMGPVDYLVVEFPDRQLTGENLSLLVDLVDRRVIRVLDLLFVKKRPDGSVTALDLRELDAGGGTGLGVFAGASSGLLDDSDLDQVGTVLKPGRSAAVVVYENVWAAPLASGLRRAGGQLVAVGRIPMQALLAALDETESAAGTPAQASTRPPATLTPMWASE